MARIEMPSTVTSTCAFYVQVALTRSTSPGPFSFEVHRLMKYRTKDEEVECAICYLSRSGATHRDYHPDRQLDRGAEEEMSSSGKALLRLLPRGFCAVAATRARC